MHSTVFHTLEDRGSFRHLVRSNVPYPDRDAIVAEHTQLSDAMQLARDAAAKPLLVDLRRAAGRADPEFEQAMAIWRSAFLSGHPRLIVLVATELGRTHVEGHMKSDGNVAEVLLDEAEALRRVREG
ncbi:MAG: hypothetical protein JJ863_24340 [Deltaproteobacteria bacterium]|nr:hypothetical protein [Deltaproteobacteria bacterium]